MATQPDQPPPTLRYPPSSAVAPGDRLGSARHIHPGSGTYHRGLHVYAATVGTIKITTTTPPRDESATTTTTTTTTSDPPPPSSARHTIEVVPPRGKQLATSQVLSVNDVIIGRVSRITLQQAIVEIVAAGDAGPLREKHEGAIRREDVRSGGCDELDIGDCFRPGDVVMAKIISLGDSRRYFLSTAENELGVVRGWCASTGESMVPINWKEMETVSGKVREMRKCARPRGNNENNKMDISTSN
eukprot:CAMPEP_0172498344 /NCGR_PEP_ID=MMETSP1066-20121228/112619_1 /TAXON_ID=671091 /ORGANISM="Coscinodiscus wailesii, Strain CCMP2513" /LENGTH=243 /DNA_ID=CAMNT_0013271585 /DNA_START=11 /DNA_END=742 /DNA_ORIENTATION=-